MRTYRRHQQDAIMKRSGDERTRLKNSIEACIAGRGKKLQKKHQAACGAHEHEHCSNVQDIGVTDSHMHTRQAQCAWSDC
jgi:hypothetical protein